MSRLSRSVVRLALMLVGLGSLFGPVSAANKPCLRHFVAFKFKDAATPAQIESAVTAFLALKNSISEVQAIEGGPNNSPEQLNKGLTHAFLVTFAGPEERDIYLTHPAHEEFKKFALPLVEDALVIDFMENKKNKR